MVNYEDIVRDFALFKPETKLVLDGLNKLRIHSFHHALFIFRWIPLQIEFVFAAESRAIDDRQIQVGVLTQIFGEPFKRHGHCNKVAGSEVAGKLHFAVGGLERCALLVIGIVCVRRLQPDALLSDNERVDRDLPLFPVGLQAKALDQRSLQHRPGSVFAGACRHCGFEVEKHIAQPFRSVEFDVPDLKSFFDQVF